jgi:uncharacterized membrane protein HdeD (DUF308 family)
MDIFKNPDGSFSSRRVFGVVLVIAGIVAWFLHFDATVSTIVMGYGAVLLGITTADPRPPSGQ